MAFLPSEKWPNESDKSFFCHNKNGHVRTQTPFVCHKFGKEISYFLRENWKVFPLIVCSYHRWTKARWWALDKRNLKFPQDEESASLDNISARFRLESQSEIKIAMRYVPNKRFSPIHLHSIIVSHLHVRQKYICFAPRQLFLFRLICNPLWEQLLVNGYSIEFHSILSKYQLSVADASVARERGKKWKPVCKWTPIELFDYHN